MFKKLTKDMIVAEILEVDEDIAAILAAAGMGCIFCFSSQSETLEEACFVHGMDPDEILDQLNEYLQDKYEAEALDGQ